MPTPSLAVPLLIGGHLPEIGTIHFVPSHVASWTSSSKAGPSRHVALAAPDNTIWVYPYLNDIDVHTASDESSLSPHPPLPSIKATSPTPSGTPQATRPANPRVTSFSNRSRAPSNASSHTSSSRRRITSFSPPTSAQPVTATISPTTATVSAGDGHARVNSLSERAELLEHLREQQTRNGEEGKSRVGLGINLGRKVEAQGQADHDRSSGATSPKSVRSSDSQQAPSIGGRLMGWAKGAGEEKHHAKKELEEQVAEIAVEREMELETEKDTRQEEEMKTVEEAITRASPTHTPADQPIRSTRTDAIRRIILGKPGLGKVVSMEVYEELGLLCVLRDIG